MTAVEGLKQKVSSYVRRWLGAALETSTCMGIPTSSGSLSAQSAREHLQNSGSRDAKVSGTGIVMRTESEWRAAEAVQQAETRLKHKAILGTVARGRTGIGYLTATRYDSASGSETEVGAGGGASLSRGRKNQQSSGHVEARCMDKVVAGDGAK